MVRCVRTEVRCVRTGVGWCELMCVGSGGVERVGSGEVGWGEVR